MAADTLQFADTVNPGERQTYSHRVQSPGTVTYCKVVTYSGQRLDLRVTPEVSREGNAVPLAEMYGQNFVAGNGEVYEFRVSEDVGEGDQIQVHVDNVEDQYEYDFTVIIRKDENDAQSLLTGWLN